MNATKIGISAASLLAVFGLGILLSHVPLGAPGSKATATDSSATWQAHFGMDVSGSTETIRKRQLGLIDALMLYGLPRNTQLNLWAFAKQPALIYRGTPKKAAELWPTTDKLLVSAEGCGTCPTPLLEAMLNDIATSPADRHVVVLFTDGENSGESLRPIIELLATQPQLVAVWVVGVSSDINEAHQNLRARVEAEWAPLADRVVISGMNDLQPGMARVKALLRQAKKG